MIIHNRKRRVYAIPPERVTEDYKDFSIFLDEVLYEDLKITFSNNIIAQLYAHSHINGYTALD